MRPSLKFIWDGRRKFQPRFAGVFVFVAVLLILISAGVTKYPAVYLVADFLRDAACQATEILATLGCSAGIPLGRHITILAHLANVCKRSVLIVLRRAESPGTPNLPSGKVSQSSKCNLGMGCGYATFETDSRS